MLIRLVSFNARFTHSCLALFYVRNELGRYFPDAETEIFQLTINDSYYENILKLGEGNPDYIFFSAAIWNSERVESLIRDLKICLPETICVVGGPQAEIVAKHLRAEECSCVVGEIENVDEQFYEDLRHKKLERIYSSQNPVTKRNSLSYPYRDSDFAEHLQNRHIYYESSRGCPFSCTYCLSARDRGSFHKPLDEVKKELLHLLRFSPSVVRFIDRTFNDNPKRALAIWKFLAEQKTNTLFHFEIAPDRFTEDMYSFLENLPVGLFQFEIGIQSTNEKTLKEIRRYIDPEKTRKTVSRLVAAGNIHLHADLILGLPYETPASYKRSLQDVYTMGPHYIQMGLLKILPDTPICQDANELEYLHSEKTPYSILATKWMDYKTISELYWLSECVEKFYNNRFYPSLWNYLRKKDEDISLFFQNLLQVCKVHGFFERAATQEFMTKMLLNLVEARHDRALLEEILRYDWLRCGHRFIPAHLSVKENQEPLGVRKRLYQSLPEEIAGHYDRKERSKFFKRGLFLPFSNAALEELGFGQVTGERYLRFSQQKDNSLFGLSKVTLI